MSSFLFLIRHPELVSGPISPAVPPPAVEDIIPLPPLDDEAGATGI